MAKGDQTTQQEGSATINQQVQGQQQGQTQQQGQGSQTQQTGAWAPAAGYFPQLYQAAMNAFNQTNGNVYRGQTYAGPTGSQQTALQGLNAAGATASAQSRPVADLALSQIRGDWLDPSTNRFLARNVETATQPIRDNFNRNIGAINDSAISGGAYGGSRQDLQENTALDQANRAVGDVSSQMYGENYARERAIQQNAPGMLSAAQQMSFLGPQTQLQTGGIQQGWRQAALDDQQRRFQAEQQAPWSGIGELANILTAGGYTNSSGSSSYDNTQNSSSSSSSDTQGTNTNSQTTTIPGPPPWLQVLQGVLGAGTTAASIASGLGWNPLAGGGGSGGIGNLLAGLFGGGNSPLAQGANNVAGMNTNWWN